MPRTARDEIAALLGHYIGMAFRNAGLGWDGDNVAEVDILADKIEQVARDEADGVSDELDKTRAEVNRLDREIHQLWAAINQTRNDIGP